ncbi:Spy/CpxP family protein refolding chaperone [Trinickia diaoshuihuensis]|jgi:esterase/lipase|uniref:Spy/CpxP family protein refolding chaperone n=1 Tax=Trinickia diaoshuihuensis TaxID=2292265 RepID=UPI000E21CA28|nr:Spy/CpxP family protein refolding chaperone [Trinickia diaoshuihuensis]
MKRTIVILACALATSGAFAQASAPQAAPGMAASATADARAAKREARVEERIAYLHSQLKITAAQEPQWKAFADVMRSNGQNMSRLFRQRTQAEQSQSALDNMKQYAEIAQAHADDMKQLVDAFQPLYDSFSPEQKKLADTTFRQVGDHGERGGKSAAPAKE